MVKRANPGSTRQLLVLVIILQLFCCHLWGLDPNKTVDQYLVDQWEMVEGIPSNTILCINQTQDGYLWFGTSMGLVRFDGIKFIPVPFAEKEEIYSQEIRDLFVDREGDLWIGGSLDLILYRYTERQFKIFTSKENITNDGIRHIKNDMRGNIWISFDASYVNRFYNGEFIAFNDSHGLIGKRINAIIEDRQGNLLFGTRECGIFTYKEGKFFKYPVPNLDNLIIITMCEDRSGDLWIGTSNGLLRITGVNGETGKGTRRYTVEDGLSNDGVTSITEDSEGNLWIGTDQGLNRIKKKEDGSVGFEIPGLLKSLPIYYLFEDREKSLWIGTDGSGIRRLKDGKFMSYALSEAYPGENPLSLWEDRHGDTWIGTASGKLFHCRDKGLIDSAAIRQFSGTAIAAVAEDAEGNLWLGTSGKGIFQKKNQHFTQFTTREGLVDNLVTSIYRDSRDNLWFSTFDGVSVFRSRDRNIESLRAEDGLLGKRVHNVYESKGGDIWIAADKGITVLKNGKAAKKNMNYYLRGVSVTCIYEDPSAPSTEGRVYWIATDGTGLTRLNLKDGTDTSFTYTTDHGMVTNFIYQFFEDFRGNFWLMSNSGILRVDKNELNHFASGGVNKINCTSFGTADGMKSLEFDNKFSRNSALKARNGEFWFITKKGISIVNPGKMPVNKTPPPVVIEEAFFNGQSIPLHAAAEPLTFKGITNLSFHFTAPTFLSPEKTKFQYRLEGVDRQWIYLLPGQVRAAYYKDLEPGTYTFRVIACNAEGVWNQEGDSVIFTLKPHFHETFVFKIIVLVLLTALVAVGLYILKKNKHLFEKKAKYKSSPLNPDFAEECITKLKYLMEIEKVYSDADISLQSLAEKMSISPHQLSQLLNEKLDRNFADFINWYRIEEVKNILENPIGARRKISALAIEVGFNTMVAFYKAFKKYTDMTPGQYKKSQGIKSKY